jgi:hypothetical protein
MVNEEHSKKRDKEVSFRIETRFTDTYFGRAVSPDTIQEVLGRELKEEELLENVNHYTKDYFLCISCEERLAKLESYYSKCINASIENIFTNNIGTAIGMLFWASILWRISVTDFSGLKLTNREENKLRNILNTCLNSTLHEIESKTSKNISLLSDLAYILLKAPAGVSSNLYISHPRHRFPYCLIINEYVLFFYTKKSHIKGVRQSFYGLDKLIDANLVNDANCGFEKVRVIPEQIYQEAVNLLLKKKTNLMYGEWVQMIEDVIDHLGLQVAAQEKSNIISETLSDFQGVNEQSIIHKYSLERFTQCLFDVLQKYCSSSV